MNEFKARETPEIKLPESQGFKEIKPQSDITPSSARQYWDDLFQHTQPEGGVYFDDGRANEQLYDAHHIADTSDEHQYWDKTFDSERTQESKVYHDDNGEKYREGDNLLPNKSFEVNGYSYKTDDKGRVVSAEGQLRIPEKVEPRDMPSMNAVGKGDQLQGDEKFHLIAHRFGAGDGIENLVPGDAKLNHGDYWKLEDKLAGAIKDGADVSLKVEPRYEGDSNRPIEFRVSYTIDGEKDIVVFKNGSETQ